MWLTNAAFCLLESQIKPCYEIFSWVQSAARAPPMKLHVEEVILPVWGLGAVSWLFPLIFMICIFACMQVTPDASCSLCSPLWEFIQQQDTTNTSCTSTSTSRQCPTDWWDCTNSLEENFNAAARWFDLNSNSLLLVSTLNINNDLKYSLNDFLKLLFIYVCCYKETMWKSNV